MLRASYVFVIFLFCLILSSESFASPHHYCRKYIEEASQKTGVLPEILWAVAKTESSFEGDPWPWTVDVQGKGYYFPDKRSARQFLNSLPEKLRYQTDVGCMQLNWGFHGKAFPHLYNMLNPRLNVIYAAYFLKELYGETGEWAKAVANYHSRKWAHGGQYANHVAHLVNDYLKEPSAPHSGSKPAPFSDPSYKGRH